MAVTVPTASLDRTPDGTPYSAEFQDIYHPAEGGLAQARHVFLGGNGLPERWRGRDAFVIVETGFGLGLNFVAAWHAWREDPQRPRRLHFVSIERSHFAREALVEALSPFDELKPLATGLAAAWFPPVAGFHRLQFDGGNVLLTLILGEVAEQLPQLVARADAFFLDGFSPVRNPGMWSPEVVRELARIAAPGATLATWTVAGGVRAALLDAGFAVERRPGFGAKREMLAGYFTGSTAAPGARERHAVVVGGGLAGTLVAERLASRDWHVDVVDARAERTTAAIGGVRPIVNLKDAVNAQISRVGYFNAVQHFHALQRDGYHVLWNRCGTLQLAEDEDEAERFAAIVHSHGYPPELLQFADAARARELAGRTVRGAGFWFPAAAIISPASLAVASLARAGARVRRITGRRVERIEREGAAWRALDADGRVVAEAHTLVLANALDAARLLPEARLRLGTVRGQITYLPPSPARDLRIVVSGAGYVAPLPEGGHSIGASYQHDDADGAVRAADHRDNLSRAEALLPGFTEGLHPMHLDGWTGFRTTVPDRLPIYGEASVEGVHLATGLGSHGLLWAPLGAELIASALEGEPLPLASRHVGAISPRRFLS